MAYTIKKTDGTTLAVIADGSANTSTDLTLIGKNYLNYGTALNENLVRLLESFANTTAPTKPLKGQLWYDTVNNDLKIYNGTGWLYTTTKAANINATGTVDAGNLNTTGTLNVTGNSNVGNLGASGLIVATGNVTGGNLVTGGVLNVTGNANVGNLGTSIVIATSNITGANINTAGTVTASRLISNVATGTAPLTVTSTTQVANLNAANAGYADNAGNATTLLNGNSNVNITANSNVSIYVAGNATARAVFTSTGANIAGTANVSGNANVGNLGTATAVITTGNINTINSGLLQNGNSNITIDANNSVRISSGGTANVLVISTTGANITGTTNIATANVTTINSGLMQNGNSNVTITANGNVTISAVGGARITATSTGANITGTLGVSGVSSLGAIGNVKITGGTSGQYVTTDGTGNLSFTTLSISAGSSIVNGNSSVSVAANSNVTVSVTAANSYTFATGSFAPSANATVQLGLTGARWSNIWGVASSAQYADLAEKYHADDVYSPGTVMCLGGDHEVTKSTKDLDENVFGVISTNPAYLMNDKNEHPLWLPIVLTGRANVMVTGTVTKGQWLVSAGDGTARGAGEGEVQFNLVIGRSLMNKTINTPALVEAYISTK